MFQRLDDVCSQWGHSYFLFDVMLRLKCFSLKAVQDCAVILAGDTDIAQI
jgi:hypothetical protein